jgi:hypothetical protein
MMGSINNDIFLSIKISNATEFIIKITVKIAFYNLYYNKTYTKYELINVQNMWPSTTPL